MTPWQNSEVPLAVDQSHDAPVNISIEACYYVLPRAFTLMMMSNHSASLLFTLSWLTLGWDLNAHVFVRQLSLEIRAWLIHV